MTADGTPPVAAHERLLAGLAFVTFVGLAWRAGLRHSATLELCGASAVYFALVAWLRVGQRLRLLVGYAFTLWFYLAIARLAPGLGLPVQDVWLLDLDQMVFSQTPAVWLSGYASPGLTDIMSGCYFSYLVYLHIVVADILTRETPVAIRRAQPLFMVFVVGFVGYLMLPAIGPARSAPELFSAPLSGGWLTRLNAFIVSRGSSVYDVFPSLHVAAGLTLLAHDKDHRPRRFWIAVVPAAGFVVSTMYLRYHYGVDVLAGIALFGAVRVIQKTRGVTLS